VLEQFRRAGVPTLVADELAHGVTAAGTEATAAIAARFGAGVIDADGSVNREVLGPIVFADPAARRELEAMIHPAVYRAIEAGFRAFQKSGDAIALVEIPLLYESGHAKDFDRVIVTSCPPETQVARLVLRGIAEPRARQILAAQKPTAEKASQADYIINTGGTTAETDAQVRDLLQKLR
jgi:dephospho-CoA kinase